MGGTPTSSGGGTASQLQVFTIGGASTQSPPPKLAAFHSRPTNDRTLAAVASDGLEGRRAGHGRVTVPPSLAIQTWKASSQNSQIVTGTVMLHGKPVSGVGLQVGDYVLQARTNAAGQFNYRIDTTLPERHVATVSNVSKARAGGRSLSAADKAALLGSRNGFSVGYEVTDLHTSRGSAGNVVLTGRAVFSNGQPVPPVALYTYQLSGTITDAAGKPVVGAIVVTRTQDRDFWTFSKPSDAAGHYTSFFAASDEAGDDPVPLTVQVASGPVSFSSGAGPTVKFSALQSATLNIQLPGSATAVMALPTASSYPGAIYEGLLMGVSTANGLVKPLSESWPDKNGRFRITLPASVRGKKLALWEDVGQFFSAFAATPGGRFDMSSYPTKVLDRFPQAMGTIVAK